MSAVTPLYLAIAGTMAERIREGSLRPGHALPSVRAAALQQRASRGTIVEAYAELERQGLVEARDRSGFYVRAAPLRTMLAVPQSALKRPTIVRVDRRERVRRVLGDLASATSNALASAFPDPRLLPLDSLASSLSAANRGRRLADSEADLQLGLPLLRQMVARRYLELGYSVPLDEIVITCGGMESISLGVQAVTRPGDLVLIDSPMFFSGLRLLDQLGLGAVEMPTDPLEGLDLGQLERVLAKHHIAACLLMTNCQNPLGFTMTEGKKEALVAILTKHRVPLVENDVYSELQFDLRHSRAAKAFDRDGQVLHCGSFTKSLAPGYKVGWIAPGIHRDAVVDRKFATTLGTAIPSQAAIAHYLLHNSYDRHLRRLRRALAEGVHRMSEAAQRHFPPETRISRPQGGYVLWVQLPDHVDAFALFEAAAARGIAVAPGPIFSSTSSYRNCIRLNCSHPWSVELERAIAWLGKQAVACSTTGIE